MAASMQHVKRKFLLQFAHEHVDFKLAELKAIAGLYKINLGLDEKHYDKENPFLVVDLPSEFDGKRIMGRTVLGRSLFELWASGSSQKELNEKLQELPKEFVAPYLVKDSTYRIRVETFNKSLTSTEKIEHMESLPDDVLNFHGKVDLKCPDQSFHLLELYEYESHQSSKDPVAVYFGRWIADGERKTIRQYSLKARHFIALQWMVPWSFLITCCSESYKRGIRKLICCDVLYCDLAGNTSMDPTLSLIMSNMAQVSKNQLVFDPFVGTGSLLVPCARFGAYVLGTDIDYQIIHGKGRSSRHKQKYRGPDENIRANLRQYDLEGFYLDALLGDASKHTMWRQQAVFDAIVTDPPYGIREAAKKIGTEKDRVQITKDMKEDKDGHIPQRVQYDLSDIFSDLLNFAAKFLRLYGKLVYWLPVYRPEYSEENIPCHPCLELRSNCEQKLSVKVSRRLVTMEKVREYQDNTEEFHTQVAKDHYSEATFRDRYFKPASKQSVINTKSDLRTNQSNSFTQSSNSGVAMKTDAPPCNSASTIQYT